MSVATEFPPVVDIPERARRSAARPVPSRRHLAVVPVQPEQGVSHERISEQLQPARPHTAQSLPGALGDASPRAGRAGSLSHAPARLTRRGIAVLTVATLVGAAVLLLVAHLSVSGASAAPHPAQPSVVTVEPGDTLWSIARSVSPHRDPRATVDDLVRRNHLSGVALVPGQRLTVT